MSQQERPQIPGIGLALPVGSFNGDANIIDEFAKWTDTNIQLVRAGIYGAGLVGVAVIFRSIRLATKFTSPMKIPKSFIRKGVKLRGLVKEISTDGTLHVDHIPIFRMPWHSRSSASGPYLPLKLASVQPTIPGIYTLKLRFESTAQPQKQIWFQCLERDLTAAPALVFDSKRGSWKGCLNVSLVRDGLATIQQKESHSKDLLQQLQKAQSTAQKSRAGMWWRETEWDRFVLRIKTLYRKLKGSD